MSSRWRTLANKLGVTLVSIPMLRINNYTTIDIVITVLDLLSVKPLRELNDKHIRELIGNWLNKTIYIVSNGLTLNDNQVERKAYRELLEDLNAYDDMLCPFIVHRDTTVDSIKRYLSVHVDISSAIRSQAYHRTIQDWLRKELERLGQTKHANNIKRNNDLRRDKVRAKTGTDASPIHDSIKQSRAYNQLDKHLHEAKKYFGDDEFNAILLNLVSKHHTSNKTYRGGDEL